MIRRQLWLVLPVAVITTALLLWTSDIRQGLIGERVLSATDVQGDHFPLTLSDPVGLSYTLESPPQKIVSATLATDEILSALVSPERITAVTHLVDNPAISNVAGFYPENIQRIRAEVEQIIAQQPDLVFVSTYTRAETVRQLLGSRIPVVRLNQFSSLADIRSNILTIAQLTNSQAQAERLLQTLDTELDEISTRVQERPRPRVLYYNLNNSSAGPETTIDEIIQLSGGFNVLRDTGITGSGKIREEMAIGLQPDVILVSGWAQPDSPSPAQQLMQRPAWKNVPAVRKHRVYNLNGGWLFSVSQFSWQGVGKIAPLLHPEVFCPGKPQSCLKANNNE